MNTYCIWSQNALGSRSKRARDLGRSQNMEDIIHSTREFRVLFISSSRAVEVREGFLSRVTESQWYFYPQNLQRLCV